MQKKRILLVDDNPDITRTIKTILETTGKYEVLEINQGIDAIAAARIFRPDLALLDVMMPDLDGNEIAEQLNADENLQHIKIVFLTAIVTAAEVEAGAVSDITGYPVLPKPVKIKTLLSFIEKSLQE
jgi:CheY-like chemotaxis protein